MESLPMDSGKYGLYIQVVFIWRWVVVTVMFDSTVTEMLYIV